MDDGLTPAQQLLDHLGRGDVADHDVPLPLDAERVEGGPEANGIADEQPDAVSGIDQGFDGVATDEAGATGDCNFHLGAFSRSSVLGPGGYGIGKPHDPTEWRSTAPGRPAHADCGSGSASIRPYTPPQDEHDHSLGDRRDAPRAMGEH